MLFQFFNEVIFDYDFNYLWFWNIFSCNYHIGRSVNTCGSWNFDFSNINFDLSYKNSWSIFLSERQNFNHCILVKNQLLLPDRAPPNKVCIIHGIFYVILVSRRKSSKYLESCPGSYSEYLVIFGFWKSWCMILISITCGSENFIL